MWRRNGRNSSVEFKVDLATGNVTSQSADDISIASPAPRLESKMDGAVDWKINGEPVTLSVKQEPNGQAVFMKRADAQRTKLLSGPDLVADVTDDGLFVLVRSKGSSPSLWHLFSAETGREIGAVPYETGAQQACVIDSRLFYLVQRSKPLRTIAEPLLRQSICIQVKCCGREI
jgi:hypothetical protein